MMSKNEWDYNEELFSMKTQVGEQQMVEKLTTKESSFFFVVKLVILVLILTFGIGVFISGANQTDDQENTVSVEEP